VFSSRLQKITGQELVDEDDDEEGSEEEAPKKSPTTGRASFAKGGAKSVNGLVDKEGWLEKKTSIRHKWIKRYFKLTNHELHYYEKQEVRIQKKGQNTYRSLSQLTKMCFSLSK
jgi:hypothetical protein